MVCVCGHPRASHGPVTIGARSKIPISVCEGCRTGWSDVRDLSPICVLFVNRTSGRDELSGEFVGLTPSSPKSLEDQVKHARIEEVVQKFKENYLKWEVIQWEKGKSS